MDHEPAPTISGRAILWGLAFSAPFWFAVAALIYIIR